MNDQEKGAPGVAERIRTTRESLGMSQATLAQKVKTNQQTIEKIENDKIKHSSFLPQILTELGLDLDLLVLTEKKKPAPIKATHTPTATIATLPVHGAEEFERGALIVSTDPVEYVSRPQPLLNVMDGYGIIIVEDSMAPEFEPGDIALVHPHLPPAAGATCVFYSEGADGKVVATIKRLRRFTADAWHVRQWNERDGEKQDFILKRAEWQKCHVTVGKYSKR